MKILKQFPTPAVIISQLLDYFQRSSEYYLKNAIKYEEREKRKKTASLLFQEGRKHGRNELPRRSRGENEYDPFVSPEPREKTTSRVIRNFITAAAQSTHVTMLLFQAGLSSENNRRRGGQHEKLHFGFQSLSNSREMKKPFLELLIWV